VLLVTETAGEVTQLPGECRRLLVMVLAHDRPAQLGEYLCPDRGRVAYQVHGRSQVSYLPGKEQVLQEPGAPPQERCSLRGLANMVFAQRFRDTGDSGTAFGANLLGAVLGGTLEYLSLIVGYRWLLVVVALLYGLAFITGRGHLRAVSHSPTASGGSPMAEVAR
jgi:hypothetical protein